MKITRRQFIQYVSASAAAIGMSELQIMKMTEALANPIAPKVVWINGQACTGCTVSLTNVFLGIDIDTHDLKGVVPAGYAPSGVANLNLEGASTTIEDVVLDILDINYQETIMNAAGELAMQHLETFMTGGTNASSTYVVVVEGSLPDDNYCKIGRNKAGHEYSVREAVQKVTEHAAAVIALGTCSSFGGVPASRNFKADQAMPALGTKFERTNAMSVQAFLGGLGAPWSSKAVVNCAGCPPQPEMVLLTIADFLTGKLAFVSDGSGRPAPYFSDINHRGGVDGHGCPKFPDYMSSKFAAKRGDEGCLIMIGCKGPSTKSPCPTYGWNNASTKIGYTNFCIAGDHPCMGCTEKGYPDKFEPFLKY